jgi:hypothetical protein
MAIAKTTRKHFDSKGQFLTPRYREFAVSVRTAEIRHCSKDTG